MSIKWSASKRRAVFAALAAAVLLAALPVTAAKAADRGETVVRAGYFYNGDFMHKNGGAYSGYDVEYYYTAAGFAGWDVGFTEFDSLNSALAALERGDIDVMSGLSVTEERADRYLVAARKMCTAHIAVQTRADDDRFAAGDTAGMKDMTCGILKGSNVVTLYSDWCRSAGNEPHIMEYDSLDLRNAALFSGETDAIAGGSTIDGAQKIAEFPSLDLYFMFSRNRADLKAQMDRAMSIMALEDPAWEAGLYLKYFPASRNDCPSFSASEKAFIAANPVLRAAVLTDDAPFSSVGKDGSVKGILPDYMAHLTDVTGIGFSFVPCADADEAAEAAASGRADLICKFRSDVFEAKDRDVILTAPYIKMNMVQITRAGAGEVLSAAVPACNSAFVTETLTKSGSAAAAKPYANGAECFAELRAGRADAVICTQPAASWLLNRNRASEYVVSAFGGGTWDAAMALPAGTRGNTLRSIIDKAVAVDGGYVNQLITADTLEDSADLAGLLDHLPSSYLAAVAAAAVLLLVITGAALVIIIRRRSAEKRLAARQAELAAAAEANRARHAFFGAVSHDMRTPLNGIVGFTDIALKSGDPARIKDCLSKIRASGAILSGLVDDTLLMSRMENGKYVLTPSPNDEAKMLAEAVEPVRALAAEKGVRFVENTASMKPRRVMADRISFQKILLNLLSNAVRFTPAGGTVGLDCRLEDEGDGAPVTALSVSDTGVGISEEFLPRVFEPFAQENPANAGTSGSGLGLSIVKGIVDAMGGTVSAESAKGAGTRFTVRLRLEEIKEAGPRPADAVAPAAGSLSGMRALVCEDNALNLEIVRSILESAGMAADGAENGRLGVEAFEKSPAGYYDAVLLDLRMPVMDGITAARAIRALRRPDAAAVPIIAVSADAFSENVSECLAAGMNGHISKPVNADELIRTIAAAAGGNARADTH